MWDFALIWILLNGVVVYTLTKGAAPFMTRTDEPVPSSDGALVLKESYQPIGLLKFSFLFIGLGFLWSVNGLSGSVYLWWLGIPFYLIATSGLFQFFFRRQHSFMPKDRQIVVQSSHLLKGQSRQTYDYAQITTSVKLRSIGKGKRYCAMLHYPSFEVCTFFSADEKTTEVRLKSLTEKLRL